MNKRGYFKLKILNDFVENRLFATVDHDNIICDKLSKELEGANYLSNSINRAILLSFISERKLYSKDTKSDEKFFKGFLPLVIWNNIKQNYQQFVYTPTILYFWLQNAKHSLSLAQILSNKISVIHINDLKNMNLSQRQSVWMNNIIVPDFF